MVASYSQEEKIISDFLKSLGPWVSYIVIGGGYALIIYSTYLSHTKDGCLPPATYDIDSLVPRRLPQVSQQNILDHLINSGFRAEPKSLDGIPTVSYIKEIYGREVEVEFLTDYNVRTTPATALYTKYDNCYVSGIIAQPLKYIKQSFECYTPFQTKAGMYGKVVSPEAWIFHKGLTFPLRRELSKSLKDLYGIWYVATQLGELSTEALLKLTVLVKRYPKRFKIFKSNLERWLNQTNPSIWIKLEAQDTAQRLKRENFIGFIKSLTNIGSAELSL